MLVRSEIVARAEVRMAQLGVEVSKLRFEGKPFIEQQNIGMLLWTCLTALSANETEGDMLTAAEIQDILELMALAGGLAELSDIDLQILRIGFDPSSGQPPTGNPLHNLFSDLQGGRRAVAGTNPDEFYHLTYAQWLVADEALAGFILTEVDRAVNRPGLPVVFMQAGITLLDAVKKFFFIGAPATGTLHFGTPGVTSSVVAKGANNALTLHWAANKGASNIVSTRIYSGASGILTLATTGIGGSGTSNTSTPVNTDDVFVLEATDSAGNVYILATATRSYQPLVIWGRSALDVPIAAALQAMNNQTVATLPLPGGTRLELDFPALINTYLYVAVSNDLGTLADIEGLVLLNMGMPLVVADSDNDAFYSAVAGEFAYGALSFALPTGYTSAYRIYRSVDYYPDHARVLVHRQA